MVTKHIAKESDMDPKTPETSRVTMVIDGLRYDTATATAIAAFSGGIILYRSPNNRYFVHNVDTGSIEVPLETIEVGDAYRECVEGDWDLLVDWEHAFPGFEFPDA